MRWHQTSLDLYPLEVVRLRAVLMNSISKSAAALFLASVLSAACASDSDGNSGELPDGSVDTTPDAEVGPESVAMYVHTDDTLFRIDNQNFALIEVGPFNAPNGERMTDLAITPDGEIYTVSSSTSDTTSALWQINSNSGQATRVADVGEVGQQPNVGMTFLIDGTLLATDKTGGVRKIDPLNGNVTELGEFGTGYATAGDLVGIEDGRMFAISDMGPHGNEDINNVLITINPETGAFISEIGQIGWGRVFGSAVANNRIYAFTDEGYVIEINPANGVGTERARYNDIRFWGAGVTPRAAID
jgi:streptogramin lyase